MVRSKGSGKKTEEDEELEEGIDDEVDEEEEVKGEMFTCQVCDSRVPADATHCPLCGTKFVSAEELDTEKELVEDVAGKLHKRRMKKDEERIPVVLGAKEEKALLEERKNKGKTKKKKTAEKAAIKEGAKKAAPKRKTRVQKEVRQPMTLNVLLIIGIVAIVLIGYFYWFVYLPGLGMKVDGSFSDWSDVKKTTDGTDTNMPVHTDIRKYAMNTEGGNMFFYLEVTGTMLNGDGGGVDIINIFIDNDDSTDTGFKVLGIGAEYRIEVRGYDGDVSGADLYQFNAMTKANDYDWSAWTKTGSIDAEASGSQLETKVAMSSISVDEGDDIAILFTLNSVDTFDAGKYTIGFTGRSVHISQAHVAPELAPNMEDGVPMLQITAEAVGGDNTLTAIKIHTITPSVFQFDLRTIALASGSATGTRLASGTMATDGTVELRPSPAIELKEGSPVMFFIVADVANSTAGHIAGLKVLSPSDVTIEDGTVRVSVDQSAAGFMRTYLGTLPTGIKVDGAFSDWYLVAGTTMVTDTDPTPIDNDDIDIQKAGFKRRGLMGLDMTATVEGTLLDGAIVPEKWTRGSDAPMSGDDGMDGCIIYLDTDDDTATGSLQAGIGADAAVIVEGIDGKVVRAKVMEWDQAGSGWDAIADIDEVGIGGSGIEVYIDLEDIRHLMEFDAGSDPMPMKAVTSMETWDGQRDTTLAYTIAL